MASKMVFFQHGHPGVGDCPCRPQRATCTHTVDVRKLTLRYSLHFPSLSSSVPLPGTMTHKGRQFKSVSFPRDFPHLDNVIHNHAAVWSWGEIKARILNVLQRVMVSVFHVAHMLAAIWELHPKKKKKEKKKSLDLIVGRFLLLRKKRHVCQKSRRSRANFQNAPRRHRDARGSRRGGSIRPLKLLSRLLSEIICRRHFVVESMRRRAGERGGWRERNIQTEGNVLGGGGGEGKDI